MAKVCIICYKEKDGTPVQDDFVIRFIRGIKQRLNMAKNSTLVVCPDCMAAYRERRKKYEGTLMQHLVIGGIVLVVFVLAPIFTSGFSITAVVLGVVLAALVVGLTLFSHCPKIADKAEPAAKQKKGRKK